MAEVPNPPTPEEIESAIGRLAGEIATRHTRTDKLAIIGIANGGILLARTLRDRIAQELGHDIPLGTADICFHRDDLARNPIPKDTGPTEIPVEVDGTDIVIVDDVLFTGRSVRAAINEVFDLGRPNRIELAILYDRGGRKLPIQPDFRAFHHQHPLESQVEVVLDSDNPQNHVITFV